MVIYHIPNRSPITNIKTVNPYLTTKTNTIILTPYLSPQKSAITHLQKLWPGQKLERVFMNWCWWILAGLPFQHIVRIMDCYFHEGIKVLYRVALAILILFHKHTSNQQSSSTNTTTSSTVGDNLKPSSDIENALIDFCKNIPVTPTKLLRTAFSIRALR